MNVLRCEEELLFLQSKKIYIKQSENWIQQSRHGLIFWFITDADCATICLEKVERIVNS